MGKTGLPAFCNPRECRTRRSPAAPTSEDQPGPANFHPPRRFASWHGRAGEGQFRDELPDQGEFFIQGITQGFVEASEVIAWADEVIVAAPKAEDWMIEISTCGPDDRMVVLSHLNTIKGEVDAAELAALRKARGVA